MNKTTNQELYIIENFILQNAPTVEVKGAFYSIEKKMESYDAVMENNVKLVKENFDLTKGNMALSLTIQTLGGKK